MYSEQNDDIILSSEDLYGDHSFDLSSRLSVRNLNYESSSHNADRNVSSTGGKS
jgi:hypothetical protein